MSPGLAIVGLLRVGAKDKSVVPIARNDAFDSLRVPKHPKGFGNPPMYTVELPILYSEESLRGAFSGQHPK